MRRFLFLTFLGALAACGGSPTPTGTQPPTTPGAPASVTVVAGDGQSALPGSILPVRPAVLVKDAAGVAVPGVMVTFAIDSGGGSLASTSATTGNDGMAVAGTWTLGAAAGRNVVRVIVGSLSVVRIHAMALGSAARPIIANAAMGTGGGTLQYSKAGDALNGLTVEILPASYATATVWSITADSTIVVPLPAGFSQVGPVLIVGNGQGYADSAITLTMPMRIAATDAVAPFFFDPASGTLEPIPILARSDTSAVLVTRHFTRDLMAIPGSGPALGSLRASVRAGFGSVAIVWVRTPRAQLAGDYASTFQPGTDDWEFVNYGDYLAPGGDCTGMSITAMFYHYYFRLGASPAPPLYHQFDQSLANQWDNVQGIRLVGSVQADYQARFDAGNNQRQALVNKFVAKGFSGNTFTGEWLVMTLKLNKMPVLLGLNSPGHGHTVVVYAVHTDASGSHTVVSFADPNKPGVGRTMNFDAGVLAPVAMQDNAAAASSNYVNAYALGVTTEIPLSQVQTRWKEFVAKTAGSDRYPTGYSYVTDTAAAITFAGNEWAAMGDIVYAPNGKFLAALTCPSCPKKYPGILPDGRMLGAVWDATGHTSLSDGSEPLNLTPGSTTFALVGSALSPLVDGSPGFVDWKPVTVVYLQGTITPAGSAQGQNIPVTFTFHFTPNAPPAHVTYKWDFGDGPPVTIVSVVDNPAAPHTYTKDGAYAVKVDAVDPASGRVISTASTTVTIGPQQFAWQFTSVAQTGSQLPLGGIKPDDQTDQEILGFFNGWVNNLQTTPRNSEFFIYNDGNCQDILMEMWPAGQFQPVLDKTGAVGKLIGIFGLTSPCDPSKDYNASFAMGTLGNGTLITSAVDIPKTESLVLPGGSINATMTGTTLSGTFTWRVRYANGEAVYSFTFTATQVLPAP